MDFYDCETVVGYIVPSLFVVSHMGICCYAAGGRRLEFVVFFFYIFYWCYVGEKWREKELSALDQWPRGRYQGCNPFAYKKYS